MSLKKKQLIINFGGIRIGFPKMNLYVLPLF